MVGLAIARMLGHITYLSREAMTQKFDAQRLEAARRADPVRDEVLRRLVPGLPGRPVRRAVRRQQLPHADDGHRPVRSGRHAGGTGRGLGAVELPLAADELHQRLAVSAVPVAGDRRRPDRRRQAGELLQRRRATAATTPSCCRTRSDIYGETDPGVPGQSRRRRETRRGRERRGMGTSCPLHRPTNPNRRNPPPLAPLPSPPPQASSSTAGSTTTRSSS